MSSLTFRAFFSACGALVMLIPVPAEAQVVRRFRGGGVQVQAPFVRVNVDPYGGTSVRAPFVAVDPGSVRLGIRRRFAPIPQPVVPPQVLVQPQYAVPPVAQVVPQTQAPVDYVPFPTAEELLAMDDVALITALGDLLYALDVRLSRLTTGAGWQRYLLISNEALSDPAAYLDELAQGLGRFDSVADNPEFAKIAGLPSFIATKAALRQVVARLAQPQAAEPAGKVAAGPVLPATAVEEILPTPAEPKALRGEHSILKPTTKE